MNCPYCNSAFTHECIDDEWFCEECENFYSPKWEGYEEVESAEEDREEA